MDKWNQLASKESIDKTIKALKVSGIDARFVKNSQQVKKAVLEILPEGSEVMTMSSKTLDTIGLSEEINKQDGKFKPVRDKLYAMNQQTQAQEMNKLGAAPQYALGSVHAVTEDGHVLIASNTGSQLPAYAYAALHVIWVVGAQKIVKNVSEGMKRIYEYVLPLESERAKKAYGVPGSNVSKLLIVSKEINPGRISLILVNEKLGF
ncbi:LUD domain-containing protein [Candidatus Daviesbacteria bacterium]|nr:LUD domain-containing protein [Candidatus Daviesbacteria bacterium]MBI4038814.1 LUD domain-containing protein [Candidatus Daviesbacteria bacterium]